MVAGTDPSAKGLERRDWGGFGPELRIRPSDQQRARAALMGAGSVALIVLPLGFVFSLLAHSWAWLVLLACWPLLLVALSFFGQGHNAVFVGDAGLRRVSRGCHVIAPWADLESIQVAVPGYHIVVFKVESSNLKIKKVGRGHSRVADAMVRNVPEGFELRLDRASVDHLVAEIRQRRPDLQGLATWEEDSRPPEVPAAPGKAKDPS